MRSISSFFILLCIFCGNTLFAQNKSCDLINTRWRIKNIELVRIEGSIGDSIKEEKFYQQFDSVEINFRTKKHVSVIWKQYEIFGKYKYRNTNEGKVLVFTKLKHFGFYENGSLDRSMFAVFLYPYKSGVIPFSADCSFKMLVKKGGINGEIFYEKVK